RLSPFSCCHTFTHRNRHAARTGRTSNHRRARTDDRYLSDETGTEPNTGLEERTAGGATCRAHYSTSMQNTAAGWRVPVYTADNAHRVRGNDHRQHVVQ